jgi:predicted ABC-class ATPase
VDSGVITFVNHGCKGAYNVGEITAFDEDTVNTDVMPDEVGGKSHEGTSIFNPVIDRHLFFMGDMSNRDIQAGEEILDNYLAFVSSEDYWAKDVIELRNQCAGTAIGEVIEYERSHHKA